MNKITQCNTLINNNIPSDFQMRVFEYESFEKLIRDFESDDCVTIMCNTTMQGNLRPRLTSYETIMKDDKHAEYIVKGSMCTINVKFYKIN